MRWSLVLQVSISWVFLRGISSIPTTLEGPFPPLTVPLDPNLRLGSDDIPMYDPALVKRVPSIFPEQIALALSTPDAMWVSWVTGNAMIGPKVTPLDPSTVASDVVYGTQSGKYSFIAKGKSLVYSQIYPFQGVLNYTSGIIHHVRLTGLLPNTKYYYICGDSSLSVMSEEQTFMTPPSPGPNSYLSRIAIIGDLGLTYNSSTTFKHLMKNNPCMVLIVGDMSYPNNFVSLGDKSAACYKCSFPDEPTRETYQPRWDEWSRFMEPLVSRVPMMVLGGNHDIEPQDGGVTFSAYTARFAVPSDESCSNNALYYSFNAGGTHFVILGAYIDFNKTSAQYAWLEQDLRNVKRNVTPWLIASWHAPSYNSHVRHYQEYECIRQQMEDLLYMYGVDLVFTGHAISSNGQVHAYERMNRVYNYDLNPCGPVHITVGDGGNIEQLDTKYADERGNCPKTPDEPNFGGICPFNYTSGPAKGKFCWNRQPD
eukprot:Gb_10273 [translate_table: standard]